MGGWLGEIEGTISFTTVFDILIILALNRDQLIIPKVENNSY